MTGAAAFARWSEGGRWRALEGDPQPGDVLRSIGQAGRLDEDTIVVVGHFPGYGLLPPGMIVRAIRSPERAFSA